MTNLHQGQLKESKSWEPVAPKQLPGFWVFFSIALGADWTLELDSNVSYAPAFLAHIK